MKPFIVVLLFFVSGNLRCQTVPDKPTVPNLPDVNHELLQTVIEDQWDRGNDLFGERQIKNRQPLNPKDMFERDELRHAQIRKMLAEGRIKTGREYFFASLIFQHSDVPKDLMLAHILAVTSVSKGDTSGKYMAAATMDRYLIAIKQPQIFGTQFLRDHDRDKKWTMEPYDKYTLSDSERAVWCVASLAEQDQILKGMQSGKPEASTAIPGCN